MSENKAYEYPTFISLAKLFTRIATAAIIRAITYPFRSTRAPSFRKDVFNTAIRTLLTHITIPQSRYLNPSTTNRYLSFCASHARPASTLSVPYSEKGKGEACAHWIGDPSAEVVILYFHGGAYFQSATAGTFLYPDNLVKKHGGGGKEKRNRKSIAALVVAYSLAPEAAFPTQLREGVAVLKELLSPVSAAHRKRVPEDVFLSGDSAGGCIALALASHLLCPHPGVEEILLEGALGGMLLYSPSVSHGLDWDSMRRNEQRDMIPPGKVPMWGAMYLGQRGFFQGSTEDLRLETDAYSEPCVARYGWWKDLCKVVPHVLVLSGGDEIFADPVRELGQRMKEAWVEGGGDEGGVVFVETPKESHIGPIVDFMMEGGKGTSSSQRVVDEWWATLLEERPLRS